MEVKSQSYEAMICPIVGGHIFVVPLNCFVALGDDASICNIGINIGGDEEVVQSGIFLRIIFTLPGPKSILTSFISVQMHIPGNISEVEFVHP